MQLKLVEIFKNDKPSHNPYFIGMNLAIIITEEEFLEQAQSQSLFYWNEPCNDEYKLRREELIEVTILILLE